jgi:di/tricarboxylate transporter
VAWQDVGSALSVKVVLLVASSLALGDALTVTGGTAALARGFVSASAGLSGPWVLAALMGLIGLLTNFVSNNAAAAIGTPLAVEIARALGLPPEPYVLAVLFGCNLCYLTPMGYQTNLLVMNAGGYAFRDFTRVGAPLFLIMWIGLSLALAQRYAL